MNIPCVYLRSVVHFFLISLNNIRLSFPVVTGPGEKGSLKWYFVHFEGIFEQNLKTLNHIFFVVYPIIFKDVLMNVVFLWHH